MINKSKMHTKIFDKKFFEYRKVVIHIYIFANEKFEPFKGERKTDHDHELRSLIS